MQVRIKQGTRAYRYASCKATIGGVPVTNPIKMTLDRAHVLGTVKLVKKR